MNSIKLFIVFCFISFYFINTIFCLSIVSEKLIQSPAFGTPNCDVSYALVLSESQPNSDIITLTSVGTTQAVQLKFTSVSLNGDTKFAVYLNGFVNATNKSLSFMATLGASSIEFQTKPYTCIPTPTPFTIKKISSLIVNYNRELSPNIVSEFYIEFSASSMSGVDVICQVMDLRCDLTPSGSNSGYVGTLSITSSTKTSTLTQSQTIRVTVGDLSPFVFQLPPIMQLPSQPYLTVNKYYPGNGSSIYIPTFAVEMINDPLLMFNVDAKVYTPSAILTTDSPPSYVYLFDNLITTSSQVSLSSVYNMFSPIFSYNITYINPPDNFQFNIGSPSIATVNNERFYNFFIPSNINQNYAFLAPKLFNQKYEIGDLHNFAIPFPFGYNKVASTAGFTHRSTIYIASQFNAYSNISIISYNINDKDDFDSYSSLYTQLDFPNKPDNTPPVLTNVEYIQLTPYSCLVKVSATDNLSGIQLIRFNEKIISLDHAITTNPLNTTIAFEYSLFGLRSFIPTISVVDRAFNYFDVADPAIPNINLVTIPPLPSNNPFHASKITYFKFNVSTVNTATGGMTGVKLLFNVSDINIYYRPRLTYFVSNNFGSLLPNAYGKYLTFEGEYDLVENMYRIDFFIQPNRLPGKLVYSLSPTRPFAQNAELFEYLGQDSVLTLTSIETDELPPVISKITASPSVTIDEFTTTINWTLKVFDTKNGFDYGLVNITSNINQHQYEIKFNASNRIEGDLYNGSYVIIMNIELLCTDQEYSLQSITLVDKAGWTSSTNVQISPINPLITYSKPIQSIKITCPSHVSDDNPPQILDFNVLGMNTVDIGSPNESDRTVTFNAVVTDDNVGISISNNPLVHLWTDQYRWMAVKMQSITLSGKNVTYTATTVIPYGFGVNGIALSVDGITDNNFNIASFTSYDLKLKGLAYKLSTKFIRKPIIELASTIYRSGGYITLQGRSFYQNTSCTVLISYNDGSKNIKFIPTNPNDLFIVVPIAAIPTQPYITLQVRTPIGVSNVYQVTPRELPKGTPTPSPTSTVDPHNPNPICPGSPACNGRGVCLASGCNCFIPWFGPECNSETLPIPKPDPNPDTPTIITNNNSTQKSVGVVSIHAIREYSPTLGYFKQYRLDDRNWTLSISGNSTIYSYSTSIDNDNTTVPVQIDIQWFEKPTNITFAGDVIPMSASSLKYTISLGSYQFSDRLNSLQMVMSAEIRSDDGDCSSKQAGIEQLPNGNGNVNDLKWLRLIVDQQSLYGRFNSKGYVDGRVQQVTNTLLTNDVEFENTGSSKSSSLSYIGVNIPYYEVSVLLDPDFTNIVNIDDPSNQFDEYCGEKKGLRMAVIAGIIVACVVFFALLITIVIVLEKNSRIRLKIVSLLDPK